MRGRRAHTHMHTHTKHAHTHTYTHTHTHKHTHTHTHTHTPTHITTQLFSPVLPVSIETYILQKRCLCVCPHNLNTTDKYNRTVFLTEVQESSEW